VIVPYRGDGMNVRGLKLSGELGQIVPLPFDLFDLDSVMRAIVRSNVVINLIGSEFETRNWNYHDTHVKAPHRLAKLSKEAGVSKFIHLSALGANFDSESQFLKSKAEGEAAVRDYYPDAVIIRPGAMFGEMDHFITRIQTLVFRKKLVPVINDGRQLLQPAFVRDVAKAVANSVTTEGHGGKVYHLGGPDVFQLSHLIELVQTWSYRTGHVTRWRSWPVEVAAFFGWLREFQPLPHYKFYNRDTFVQQQYDILVPSAPGTYTFKDLYIDQPEHLFPMVVDILRPSFRENAPRRYGIDHLTGAPPRRFAQN